MATETYMILEAKRNEVEKKLKRLQKKADRYNVPFKVTASEPYGHEVVHMVDGRKVKNIYEVYDLTIESEEIKNGNYTILCRIEHTDEGNIVTVFSGEMVKEWATIPAHCDHCNGNHGQKFTFIVDDGNERKQVGRTCLKEYCGIDPQIVGMVNQFFDEIEEYCPENYDWDGNPIPHGYETTEILALAIMAMKEQGYVRSDDRDSNKSYIARALCENERPTEEAMEEARKLSEAIEAMDVDTAVEAMLNNVQTRIKCYYCKRSDFGYFAYAPLAYERYMKKLEEQKRRDEARNALAETSDFVGTVGVRDTFKIKEATLLTSFEGSYGWVWLYQFIDTNGNVLKWFASSPLENTDNITSIKATVKDHSTYEGIRQTMLSRVKIA